MVTQAAKLNEDKKEDKVVVPNYLIYEMIDGKPIYYRGYKEVLNDKKKKVDIMGYGELQIYLLSFLSDFLKIKIGDKFRIFSGETGIHLKRKSNLSLDLFIVDKKPFKFADLTNNYLEHSPKIVIEVDTKADGESLDSSNYYNVKTKKLLEFGVEKVVWVFTETEQVMVAVDNQPWIIVNWTDEIEILGCVFSIQQVIDEAEQEI